MEMAVFWVVAPCSLVQVYRRFRGVLMMEAASTSKTSVNFYQTTRRNNPEDSNLHWLSVFIRATLGSLRFVNLHRHAHTFVNILFREPETLMKLHTQTQYLL
jgi:hypothetical protein